MGIRTAYVASIYIYVLTNEWPEVIMLNGSYWTALPKEPVLFYLVQISLRTTTTPLTRPWAQGHETQVEHPLGHHSLPRL